MKKAANIIGFVSAFSAMIAASFKFNHFPGAETTLYLTGLLLSIYFPAYIIAKMSEKSEGRIRSAHIVAALAASLTDLGITFRIWHWPGAAVLLTLGLTIFSFVFLPLLLILRSKEAGTDNMRNAAGALGLAAFALGTLFKLQHWQGAPILLTLSPSLLFLIYFPKYIIDQRINNNVKNKYLRNSFFVIVIGTLVALYFIKSIEIHDMTSVPKINDPQSQNLPD